MTNSDYPYGSQSYMTVWNAMTARLNGDPRPGAGIVRLVCGEDVIDLLVYDITRDVQLGDSFMVEGKIVNKRHPECSKVVHFMSEPAANHVSVVNFRRID